MLSVSYAPFRQASSIPRDHPNLLWHHITPYHPKQKTHGTLVREFTLNLPSFLCLDVWRRHGYGIEDVQTTLVHFHSKTLWILAIALGIAISNSTISLSYSRPSSMVLKSKAIAIRKICQVVEEKHGFESRPSILNTEHISHVPPLPHHVVSEAEWQAAQALFTGPPTVYLNPITRPGTLPWRGIHLIPLREEGNCLLMIRAVPWRAYEQSRAVCHFTISNRPLLFEVCGEQWAGIGESCFFSRHTFQPPPPPPKKQRSARAKSKKAPSTNKRKQTG